MDHILEVIRSEVLMPLDAEAYEIAAKGHCDRVTFTFELGAFSLAHLLRCWD